MLVKEIMNKNVKVAQLNTPVRELAVTMCFNKISGVPVINENNDIIGVISEKDILNAMYPNVDEYMQSGGYDFEQIEKEYTDVLSRQVKDIIKPGLFTVSPEDPILKAASIMCAKRIRRIPVADKGKLVGIVSIGDVHKAIFQQHLDEGGQANIKAVS
ncbi:MAG: CBS domain-containing protein [Gammaproteobacteria bacterium]|nr:CBS domain-containing protein [Gammaproteobacteria bacterium]